MKILYDTDGGGDEIYIKGGLNNNNNRFCHRAIKAKTVKYFIGLVIYGPKLCVPIRKIKNDD